MEAEREFLGRAVPDPRVAGLAAPARTESVRVGVWNADVLIARFERVLRHSLAAAGIGKAKDMRIGRAVDALEQVRHFPHHQRRIADLIAVADVDLDRLSASEETQGLLRCLTVAARKPRTSRSEAGIRALI